MTYVDCPYCGKPDTQCSCVEPVKTDTARKPMIDPPRSLSQKDTQRLIVLLIKHVPEEHHDYVEALEMAYKFDQSCTEEI